MIQSHTFINQNNNKIILARALAEDRVYSPRKGK